MKAAQDIILKPVITERSMDDLQTGKYSALASGVDPLDIILKPVITEKSMDDLQTGKYTFKVAKDANKSEIKKAVEQLFGVEVAKVNTMNCNGRDKRVGRYVGKTPDWKKAIVTLTADSKAIEFFEGMV